MKKRYLIMALIILIFCLSAVSASENATQSDDVLELDDNCLLSDDENILSDEDNGNSAVTDSSENSTADDSDNSTLSNSTENSTASDNDTDVTNTSTNTQSNTNTSKTTVAKAKSVVTKDISSTYGTVKKYSVKVLDKYGNPIEGKAVTVTLGTKSVVKYTNSNGIAVFTFDCKAGSYVIKYKVDKVTGTNNYTVKNKVSFSILKWGLTGDVTKNTLIKNNMPNNTWVKKAVAATKKGIPLLKFKGGDGKVVFITAGVHGNEISSQVAAMKLIEYLTNNPIKGTVYIMPFVNVKAISKKVRYTDKDFNRIAANSGTIPNKIVKLVVKYKCDAYGDFHTTKPGGAPGKNVVMGSKSPSAVSEKITNYIVKKCKVNKILYNYAGQVYSGAIADNVNKKGIPAVLCEVMLPHNTITTKTVNLSLKMMKYLLKFNSVI